MTREMIPRTVTKQEYELLIKCDHCEKTETELQEIQDGPMITVYIAVGAGEEGGKENIYDYCEAGLEAKADALFAAGSTAPLVGGDY